MNEILTATTQEQIVIIAVYGIMIIAGLSIVINSILTSKK